MVVAADVRNPTLQESFLDHAFTAKYCRTLEYAASSDDFILPDFHSHGDARENEKDLSAGPVILRRVAGRMRGTMYHFMELFDTFTFSFDIVTP